MEVLLIIGALLFFAALALRELQLYRERSLRNKAFENLHSAIEVTSKSLQRTREDLFVLHALLAERSVITTKDLLDTRARLIDAPRRSAEQRQELLRDVAATPNQLVVDETESIH